MIPQPPKPKVTACSDEFTGQDLRDFMNLHGISLREFSEIFGVTQQAVTFWLSGKRKVSTTNVRLIRLFQKYPKLIREF